MQNAINNKLNTKNNGIMIIYGILLLTAYFIPISYIKFIIVCFVFYTAWIYKTCIPAFLYLAVSVSININSLAILPLLATAPIYMCAFNRKFTMSKRTVMNMTLFTLFVMLSYIFGIKSNVRTAILFLLPVLLYFSLSERSVEWEDIEKYSSIAFLLICAILVVQIFTGGVQLIYGRLSINGNIREMANAIAFPLVVAANTLIGETSLCKKHKIFNTAIIVIGALILIATLSKGTMISVLVSCSVTLLLSKERNNKKVFFVILSGIAVYLIIYYLSSLDMFRLERLSEESNGFSGRTDIWSLYWNEMKSSGITLLFGFGPGDIKRLGLSLYYSHSVFLDVLYSYGIIGFCLFMVMVLVSGYKIIKSKNIIALSIYILAILIYSTHGSATCVEFYILLAIARGISLKNEQCEHIVENVALNKANRCCLN